MGILFIGPPSIQLYKCESMQIYKNGKMEEWKTESTLVWKYAIMQLSALCEYSTIWLCNYKSMQEKR